MGILNTTPDSFSDGGRYYQNNRIAVDKALRHAELMLQQGASIIDVGGESTRPGAAPVSVQEELERVIPLLEALVQRFDALVSVDTSTATVITEAARAGASLINDVRALSRAGALEAAADAGLPVCLMHMQGSPQTMQLQPHYSDLVEEVAAYLAARAEACRSVGIPADQILVDPGFGFGKTLNHNFQLLRELPRLAQLGYPLLVGMSRKSMIGNLLGRTVDERLAGSLAAALLGVQNGAAIVRVHDVAQTADVLKVLAATNDLISLE